MSKKEDVQKPKVQVPGITAKSIIISILVSVFFSSFYSYRGDSWFGGFVGGPWLGMNWWFIGNAYMVGFGIMMMVTMFAAFVNRIRPGTFNRLEVTMMAIVAPLTTMEFGYYTMSYIEWYLDMPGFIQLSSPEIQEKAWAGASILFGGLTPGATVAEKNAAWSWLWGVTTIPRPINWSIAALTAIPWFIWWSVQYLFIIAITLLLRYVWVEVEAFENPIANIFINFIDATQPVTETVSGTKKKPLFSNKLFIIPFVIAFIQTFLFRGPVTMMMAITGDITWPGRLAKDFPLLSGTPAAIRGTILNLEWDVNAILQNPALWVPLLIELNPFQIGWCTVLPQRVLIGMLVGVIAYDIIYPVIMSSTGAYAANAPFAATSVVTARWILPSGESTLTLLFGMLAAIFIMPILINWRAYVSVVKALYSKIDPNFDPEKPISYKWAWILAFVLGILVIIMSQTFIYYRLEVYLVFSILAGLYFFGTYRVMCETGGYMGKLMDTYSYGLRELGNFVNCSGLVFPYGPVENPTPQQVWTAYAIGPASGVVCGNLVGGVYWTPGWYTITGFTIANKQKGLMKKGALVALVAVIIGALTAFAVHILMAWVVHQWHKFPYAGGTAEGMGGVGSDGVLSYQIGYNWQRTGTIWQKQLYQPTMFYGQIAAGFAIVAVLLLLQPRISILQTVSVAGIILGVWWGFWFFVPAIIGLIIRFVTIRIGGIKMFEEKVTPVMLGFLAGTFIAMFFQGIFIQYNEIFLGYLPG